MTTVVTDPRPTMRAEEAAPTMSVLASSFLAAWQTVGNGYESLTVGNAPGNGGRTVALVHDHGIAGPGVDLAQAPMRWQGLGGVGGYSGPAALDPFSLTYTIAWAALVTAYKTQEMTLVVYGHEGATGTTHPGSLPGGLVLEINGVVLFPIGLSSFEPSRHGTWLLVVGLGVLPAGVYHVALKVLAYMPGLPGPVPAAAPGGESWQVIGAEAWPNGNDQLRLPL